MGIGEQMSGQGGSLLSKSSTNYMNALSGEGQLCYMADLKRRECADAGRCFNQ